MTLHVLKEQGHSNRQIAKTLGVSEGAIRYHLQRGLPPASDRRRKTCRLEQLGLAEVVRQWWLDQQAALPEERSPNVKLLWEYLVEEYAFPGSYKSVRKYVRSHFPQPKKRPFRRIETPPGAQTQSDWCEITVDLGGEAGPEKVYGFVMVLSHSRQVAVIWSHSMDQLAWQRVHQEAFKRLGGIAAVNRIDNLKTGVAQGAGAWGELNESYRAYARTMGFHIDPHEPRAPQQKGKTERAVGIVKRLPLARQRFDSLEALQAWTDTQLERQAKQRTCPATGLSIHASWQAELPFLRPLPAVMPEPFDLIKECAVYKDCTVSFEGRTYAVPFRYAYQRVEVRGCSGVVQMVDRQTGEIVQTYPRGTQERLLIDPACYEGESTEWVQRPTPLGRISRRLQEIAAEPVQARAIEIYAALAEVAR